MYELLDHFRSGYRLITILGTVAVGGTLLFLRRRSKRNRKPIKRNYKKDMVYFYEFPSCKTIASISPFALKVASFMRLNNIQYESIRGIRNWSKKGQIPFIELNGEEIADSNIILGKLQTHFKINENHLSEYEQGVTRTIAMMLDQQTVFSYFYYRYVIVADAFVNTWTFVKGIQKWLIAKSFPYSYRKKMYYQGIGRLSPSEIYQIGMNDLLAISKILGDKAFIHGDSPSLVDCYLFGHMAQLLYIPSVDYPHTKFVQDNCPNLVEFTERFKQQVWPDWEELCSKNAYLEINNTSSSFV